MTSFPQFVILVVDSTDRERLVISKEELYRMLAHEVSAHLEAMRKGSPQAGLESYRNRLPLPLT